MTLPCSHSPMGLPGPLNVLGSVVIAVEAGSAVWAFMPADGQAFLHQHTAARTDLRCIGRRHRNGSLPSICSFESEDSAELPPARIMDAFGKLAVLHQIGNLQVFVENRIVLLNEQKDGFMVKVPALACNLLVSALQEPDGLASSLAAPLALGNPALRFHQPLFCFPVVARVGKGFSVGKRQEGFQAQIKVRLFALQRQGLDGPSGTGDTGLPAIWFLNDADGFGCAFQRTGPAHCDASDFRENQEFVVHLSAPMRAYLGKGETVIAVAALEPGIAGLITVGNAPKEGFEGPFHPQNHILQDLGIDRCTIFPIGTYLWELGFLLVVVDRYPAFLPGFFAFLKGRIIQFPTETKRGHKLCRLLWRRAQLVLERLMSCRCCHRFVLPFFRLTDLGENK